MAGRSVRKSATGAAAGMKHARRPLRPLLRRWTGFAIRRVLLPVAGLTALALFVALVRLSLAPWQIPDWLRAQILAELAE
ncbi:MAG: hypothetical protein D6740_11000, partial [Alphaproteobacteria bacterium]